MAEVKILIVEDDWLIAQGMKKDLESYGYAITGIAESYDEAVSLFENNMPDLIFMDIRLKGKKTGIDVARDIRSKTEVPVIFLSNLADEKNFMKAQQTGPANYLLKPFDKRQLKLSIQQALYRQQDETGQRSVGEHGGDEATVRGDYFFIGQNGNYTKYHISDILLIEAERQYSRIHFNGNRSIVLCLNMGRLSDRLRHKNLFQVHRSYIVNIDHITSIHGNMLLIGNKEILISDAYKPELYKRISLV